MANTYEMCTADTNIERLEVSLQFIASRRKAKIEISICSRRFESRRWLQHKPGTFERIFGHWSGSSEYTRTCATDRLGTAIAVEIGPLLFSSGNRNLYITLN